MRYSEGCRTLWFRVKQILRKHCYPPAAQDAPVQDVLQRTEVLSPSWTLQLARSDAQHNTQRRTDFLAYWDRGFQFERHSDDKAGRFLVSRYFVLTPTFVDRCSSSVKGTTLWPGCCSWKTVLSSCHRSAGCCLIQSTPGECFT